MDGVDILHQYDHVCVVDGRVMCFRYAVIILASVRDDV